MRRTRRTVTASEFKARCLALLDEVEATRETLIVTKRGKPVARLVPFDTGEAARSLHGSVRVHGDLLGPVRARWNGAR